MDEEETDESSSDHFDVMLIDQLGRSYHLNQGRTHGVPRSRPPLRTPKVLVDLVDWLLSDNVHLGNSCRTSIWSDDD